MRELFRFTPYRNVRLLYIISIGRNKQAEGSRPTIIHLSERAASPCSAEEVCANRAGAQAQNMVMQRLPLLGSRHASLRSQSRSRSKP